MDTEAVVSFISFPEETDTYDYAEFTLATGQTDYDVKTNETDAFKNITKARYIQIRSDVDLSIKFNSTSMPSITLDVSEDESIIIRTQIERLAVTNIFITNNSGSTANIRLFMT